MFSAWILTVFFAYFAALVGIAIVGARQMRQMSDYVLGGRQVSTLTSALSSASSSTSGWTMLVFPALAFTNGMVEIWSVIAIILGLWLGWAVIAKRLRRYTIAAGDTLTLPDFYGKRFADRTGTLQTLSALITLFFLTFYVSSGLIAGSKLLETVFGLGAIAGVWVTLIAVAAYTFIGGFMAVSRTDVFQSTVMLAGFTIIPIALIFMSDSPFGGMEGLATGFWNPLTDIGGDSVSLAFILTASGWGFGTFGSQRILQRFMAVGSEDKIGPSRDLATLWTTLIFCFGLLLGMVAFPALAEAGMLEAVSDPERLYFVVSEVFFPTIVTGLLLTGVIAAIMSTADSQLLLASAVAADDLPFVRTFAYAIKTESRVWLGRLLLLIVGILAAVLAILSEESVFALVSYAWGGMGAAFGPLTILALYWRRFNYWGALASIVVGTAVSSLWLPLTGGPWGMLDAEPATPGFIAATVAAIAVTIITPPPSQEAVELFDQVNPPGEFWPRSAPGARGSEI